MYLFQNLLILFVYSSSLFFLPNCRRDHQNKNVKMNEAFIFVLKCLIDFNIKFNVGFMKHDLIGSTMWLYTQYSTDTIKCYTYSWPDDDILTYLLCCLAWVGLCTYWSWTIHIGWFGVLRKKPVFQIWYKINKAF